MARGRLLADGRRSSAWSSADGDSPSRMVNVVIMGEIRVDRGCRCSTPSGRLLDPGLAVVLFSLGLPTTLAFNPHSPQKDERARLGTVGGCARACTNALLCGEIYRKIGKCSCQKKMIVLPCDEPIVSKVRNKYRVSSVGTFK